MRTRLVVQCKAIAVISTVLLAATAIAQNQVSQWTGDLDAGSDKSYRPIVFVHGGAGTGEQYQRPAKLYASNGYPPTWINAYDYNSTGPHGGPEPLDQFIDKVRERTGFDKVDLVGHSRGTMVSQEYLADPARAAKVAHYANIGGRPANNVGGVPTIVVGSHGDKLAGPGIAQDGAKHAVFDTPDHISVATGGEAFEAVYTFFNGGKAPKTLAIQPREPIAVAGYAKVFGPNTPVAGATLDIYEVAADTGRPINDSPSATFTVAQDGAWGPFKAAPGQHYEFRLTPTDGNPPYHYYREPFVRTDLLVYLKTRDNTSESGVAVTNALTASDDSAAFVVSQLNGAIIAGRDSLKINGTEIATEGIAPEAETKVGFYVFDANQNKKSDVVRPEGPLWNRTFITAADLYIPTDPPASIELNFNGNILNVPTRKPSQGQTTIQFD